MSKHHVNTFGVQFSESEWRDPQLKDFIFQDFAPASRARLPLLITTPHSGERVPPEAPWLNSLEEKILMYDVDRYVDQLYAPSIRQLTIPWIGTPWHRYSCDLNRWADDVDVDSVDGAHSPSGRFPRGLLWSITTEGHRLMPRPVDRGIYEALLRRCFHPFHQALRLAASRLAAEFPHQPLYQLDLHSMPSLGTKEHRDPGERRAELVISDQDGRSCRPELMDLVEAAGHAAGFSVRRNWPYKGGRITETYGRPSEGWHCLQIELNRALYMDEFTKAKIPQRFEEISARLGRMLHQIADGIAQGKL
jgi:N-formylglutamate deformylase